MRTAYQIPQFHDVHSRGELDKLTKRGRKWPWVRVPTKMDGEGFKGLMLQPGGVAAFGVYVLLVEVAANLPVKGLLANQKGPLTATRLAVKTSAPVAEIEAAIELLSDPDIGWLVEVEVDETGQPVQTEQDSQDKPTADQPEQKTDQLQLAQNPEQTAQNREQKALEGEEDEEVEEEFALQGSATKRRDLLFDAVAQADGIAPGATIPPATAKRIGAIVSELRAKSATPEQVAERWTRIANEYPNATIHALTKHWDVAGRGLGEKKKRKPEPNATPEDLMVPTW